MKNIPQFEEIDDEYSLHPPFPLFLNDSASPPLNDFQQPLLQVQLPQPQTNIVARKQRLKEFSNQLVRPQPKYIADNRFAIQIMQEFTNAGLCKLSQFMNGHYQDLQEQLVKFDKEYLSEQKSEQTMQKSIFFINLQPLQLDFQDDQIIYKQTFATLKRPNQGAEKYNYLIDTLNLTIRQLDSEFIPDLDLIIEDYILYKELGNSNQQIINYILEMFESNCKFQYIPKWVEMKTRYKPILVIYKQIKILEKKDEISDRQSLKVKSKHNKKIDKLQRRLYQEQIMDPLEFLLYNLFVIFDSLIQYYEENLALKESEVVQKPNRIRVKKQESIKQEFGADNQKHEIHSQQRQHTSDFQHNELEGKKKVKMPSSSEQ